MRDRDPLARSHLALVAPAGAASPSQSYTAQRLALVLAFRTRWQAPYLDQTRLMQALNYTLPQTTPGVSLVPGSVTVARTIPGDALAGSYETRYEVHATVNVGSARPTFGSLMQGMARGVGNSIVWAPASDRYFQGPADAGALLAATFDELDHSDGVYFRARGTVTPQSVPAEPVTDTPVPAPGAAPACILETREVLYLRPVPRWEHVASDPRYPVGTRFRVLGVVIDPTTDDGYMRNGSTIWHVQIGSRTGYIVINLQSGWRRVDCPDAATFALLEEPATLGSVPRTAISRPSSATSRTTAAAIRNAPSAGMSTTTKAVVGLGLVAAGVAGWRYRRTLGRQLRRLAGR